MAEFPVGLRSFIDLVEGSQVWNVTRTPIFDQSVKDTLRIFPDLGEKLAKFLDVKGENPLRNRYGKHDGPMTGPLAGFLHCHLRDDAILIYTLKNRCINLILVCSHAEIEGKRLKLSAKRLSTYLEQVSEELLESAEIQKVWVDTKTESVKRFTRTEHRDCVAELDPALNDVTPENAIVRAYQQGWVRGYVEDGALYMSAMSVRDLKKGVDAMISSGIRFEAANLEVDNEQLETIQTFSLDSWNDCDFFIRHGRAPRRRF
jgi:mRNA-degrading endonuclease YafQ of YafQ-DinJ toxin-antitoxin module